ncbi:putative alpha 1,2 mannosyltransferase [Aspergillus avenaceus]|uniref:Mannosyltransferase n=1 Tax=Aspergillus avenaceus TaxID=36643 RepID=A0A5N6TEM6_ASPAV|nr:putative alpha 1,2 mannosyltransferase [Aspergillus avenaceus]
MYNFRVMWKIYLLLLLIRVYFALSPSYIHPDENFQGPEVFAGRILSYPSKEPWEFTTDNPIRSVFPLWPIYGASISFIKWLYAETRASAPPQTIYYTLRGVMLLLSFVLEDWAVYELVPSTRYRRATVVLVASSYVTWTYQTHTFSNSLETLLVAWGLVLIRRIVDDKRRSSVFSCAVLSFISVAGVFNRITFPAFLALPGLLLLPHFRRKPISLLSFAVFGLFFSVVAIVADTSFYKPTASLWESLYAPVITPINNLLYNSDSANLALHGLHPHYQHLLVNLPQLLGPAYFTMLVSLSSLPTVPVWLKNVRAASALSAVVLLSIFPHQEPRFLIPCVPLLLSCFRVSKSRLYLATWVLFNAGLGFLMGVYHQGGIVPAQLAMPSVITSGIDPGHIPSNDHTRSTVTVLWWKTYSPPSWLLGNDDSQPYNIETRDLMGVPGLQLVNELDKLLPTCDAGQPNHVNPVFVVAPKSVTFLDQYTTLRDPSSDHSDLLLHELWSYRQHLNLDDLDFGTDGIVPTLKRVIGRRGITIWSARRVGCN